jgi:hypothetical protein
MLSKKQLTESVYRHIRLMDSFADAADHGSAYHLVGLLSADKGAGYEGAVPLLKEHAALGSPIAFGREGVFADGGNLSD